MAEAQTVLLPMHQFLNDLDAWRANPEGGTQSVLERSLAALATAYGVRGVHAVVRTTFAPDLVLAAGSYVEQAPPAGTRYQLRIGGAASGEAAVSVDGPAEAAAALAAAIELSLDAVFSRHDARSQREQLEALDAAVRGIGGLISVERVLQLIVDRVRELVDAQYAALGIVGRFGNIEQFVTSGISDEQRARIGPLPRGHGLLGLIIRENASFLIDDIAMDPRRHGFPAAHPEMHAFLGVPVRSKGVTIGNLYLTNKQSAPRFSEADLRLVEMFALHAGIAMENARLHEEIQRLAVVDERARISQDLHDSIIQSLYAISLSLEDLPAVVAEDPVEGSARADRAIDSIHSTIRDIRNFILGLQPALLEGSDLTTGLETLAAEFRANTMIDLELRADPTIAQVSGDAATHILAMVREALSNIARHSGASRATVEVTTGNRRLRLVVTDNGRGFDTASSRRREQHGLTNLRSRAEAAGGTLELSSKVGVGTQITADIPFEEST